MVLTKNMISVFENGLITRRIMLKHVWYGQKETTALG